MASVSVPAERPGGLLRRPHATTGFWSWFTTVDHKKIGILYGITAFAFFLIGGSEALLIRVQLARPDQTFLEPAVYNELFTMHGITMVFLVVMPLSAAFFNYLLPLMIGARDVVFPRLNAFSYWAFLFAGLFIYSQLVPGRRAERGLVRLRAELRDRPHARDDVLRDRAADRRDRVDGLGRSTSPSRSSTCGRRDDAVPDAGVRLDGAGRPAAARLQPAGDHDRRWSSCCSTGCSGRTSSTPRPAAARCSGSTCSGCSGTPRSTSWSCRRWASCPRSCRCSRASRCSATSSSCSAGSRSGSSGSACGRTTCSRSGLGPVANTAFAVSTMIIAIPTGVKIFNWLGTLWNGDLRFATPMLFSIGFIAMFVIGGLSGVTHAVVPSDYQQTDTYYIVAHFHYVLFGGAIFGLFGGMYYWWPKVFGRMLSETAGQAELLADADRLQHDVRADAHPRAAGHAAPHPELSRRRSGSRSGTWSRRSAPS